MAKQKDKFFCTNCNRGITSIGTARNEGWLVDKYEQTGELFCCCVCAYEYSHKKKKEIKK